MKRRTAHGRSRPRPPRRVPTARGVAFAVLDEARRTTTFAGTLLDRIAAEADLAPADRRLARELTLGVVRRRSTLDALLQPHVRRPRHEIEGQLWTLLQLGAYQLVFLDSIPPHAAVFETVELARRLGRNRWTGLLNGVLRALDRQLTDEFTDTPAADAVPLTDGRYRRTNSAVFPDPDGDLSGYVASAFAFPRWLVERWAARFEREELLRIAFWFDTPAGLVLRVNTLHTTREELLEDLATADVRAEPGTHPQAVHVLSPTAVTELPGFTAGAFVVQDESAMGAATLLAPRPGQRVLDLCAAPGTKTTHLAERMHDQGTLVATDVSPERLALVEDNARRLKLSCIETGRVSEDAGDVPAGPFDAVLVDVPCSNTGVLGKRPEARWRLRPEDLDELSRLQSRLLTAAADRLAPGGRLVYSTCSIEPEENQHVVQRLLVERSNLRLESETHHLPGRPGDGGYQALIVDSGMPAAGTDEYSSSKDQSGDRDSTPRDP